MTHEKEMDMNLDEVIKLIEEGKNLPSDEIGYELADEDLIAPDLPRPYFNVEGDAEWPDIGVWVSPKGVIFNEDNEVLDPFELEESALAMLAAARYARERESLEYDEYLRSL